MHYFFLPLYVSFFALFFLYKAEIFHISITADLTYDGPQKIHSQPIPRIGGCGIFIGIFCSLIFNHDTDLFSKFTLITVPFFFVGLAEDLFKNISVKNRLIALATASLIITTSFDFRIENIGVAYIDNTLKIYFFSIIFTSFAITGLINAYNIIDGLNGLASIISTIVISSIYFVFLINSDMELSNLCLVSLGAIIGFIVWNYPTPKFFLGDCGAYICGIIISILSIALASRNNQISPWFIFSLNIYPIFETLFSIYRRYSSKKYHPGKADGVHLHSLIFKRYFKYKKSYAFKYCINPNSASSGCLFALYAAWAIICIIFHTNSIALLLLSFGFCFLYLFIYVKIINFKLLRILRV